MTGAMRQSVLLLASNMLPGCLLSLLDQSNMLLHRACSSMFVSSTYIRTH